MKRLPKKYKDLIKKYTYKFRWDDVDNIFVVSVDELPGCMTHGKTMNEAIKMGHEAVELWLESLNDLGQKIPVPKSKTKYNGNISLRTEPEIHEKVVEVADAEGLSISDVITQKLKESFSHDNSFMFRKTTRKRA